MKLIDLTHTISETMPVYPGTEEPSLSPASTYEKDGYRETLLHMYSHTGTHMDAPNHLFKERTTLDRLPAEQFAGSALVINCADLNEGGRIGMERIEAVRDKADRAEFLLFRTGWDAKWGTDAYFGDYPYISDDVADYLIKGKKKGVGLDVIGLDPIADENLTLHRKLFSAADIVVIENLKGLERCGEELFSFFALPLKYENADGAPVRAVAVLPCE